MSGPVQLVGPDPIPGDIGVVALFEQGLEGTEVRLVQPAVVQGRRPLLDSLVVVDVLTDVEIHLPVVVVACDELSRDGPDNVLDDRPDRRLQEERVQFRQARGQQGQVIAQLGIGRTDRSIDVLSGEPMHGQRIHDPQSRGHILRCRKRSGHPRSQHLCLVKYLADFLDGPIRRVRFELRPVGVIADQSRLAVRHLGIENRPHLVRQRGQHLALLDQGDEFEDPQIRRMHRVQRDELLDVLGHPLISRRELLQVLADLRLLFRRLAQQPLLDNEGDVLARDAHLGEPLPDPDHRIGGARETRVVEDRLLHPADKPEPGRLANLADLAQHGEVHPEFVVAPRGQIVQHLVEHEQQALIAVDGLERGHHLFEAPLGVGDLGQIRELEVDAKATQPVGQLGCDDVPQAHRGRADLCADHPVAARHRGRRIPDGLGLDQLHQLGAFEDGGNYRHEVRLAGPVVGDNQHPLGVWSGVKIQVGQNHLGQLLGQTRRHDQRLHVPSGRLQVFGVTQHLDRVDRLKRDQVAVLHQGILSISNGTSSGKRVGTGRKTLSPVKPTRT